MSLLIAKAPICPYCHHSSILVSDAEVYSRSFGRMVWRCRPCDAHVGCHANSDNKPLGRLANKELRKLKVQAHKLFDPLWERAMKVRGWTKSRARHAAYAWLADRMGMPVEKCHIGMFNEDQTRWVIEICSAIHDKRKDQKHDSN